MCYLNAKSRFAITGTPVHNSLDDLYSLIKFLHFTPLDNFQMWNYIFAVEKNKEKKEDKGTIERSIRSNSWMVFLSDYILLRRAKTDTSKG
jgi:SWI/SNF-related matrix-associated actin-dependent regulator of chromatin subfamily A3